MIHSSAKNAKRWALAVAVLQICVAAGVVLLWPSIFELGRRLGDLLGSYLF